jgi:hypothetical protein
LLITQNKQEVKKLLTDSSRLAAGSGLQNEVLQQFAFEGFAPVNIVQIRVTDNIAKESFVTTNKFTVAANPVR